jgi:colanic acid/amylovoran biosynthesis glycosyltransferase
MKIGLVLSSTPGYSETFFSSKIKGLQKQGIEVVLFTQQVEEQFNLCPVITAPKVYKNIVFQVFSMAVNLLSLLPYFNTVKRFVKLEKSQNKSLLEIIKLVYLNKHILTYKLDWLHFGFATQALGKEFLAKAIGAKMAVSFRGFDIAIYPLKNPGCYNLLWKMIDKVHTISDDLLSTSYKLGLSRDVTFEKITPAIDVSIFEKDVIKFNIPREKIHFLTIARLNWKKGIIYMLHALKELKNKGYDFSYTIAGEGKEQERIMFAITQLGLSENVFLVGKKDKKEIVMLYSKSHIYMQYSISEGFCNSVIEAQSMGLLSIVSNAEGLSENVLDHQTGWVVSRGNIRELTNKIIAVIEMPESEKISISNNAKSRVLKKFTIAQQQQKFVEFYTT